MMSMSASIYIGRECQVGKKPDDEGGDGRVIFSCENYPDNSWKSL